MTRYEWIKGMNIEQLANFLSEIQYGSDEPTSEEMYQYLTEEHSAKWLDWCAPHTPYVCSACGAISLWKLPSCTVCKAAMLNFR